MKRQATMRRLARVDRELDELITLERIMASRAWGELCGLVVEALGPYPEARHAVLAALETPRPGNRP